MKTLALLTITALMMNSAPAMEPMPAQDLGLPRPTTGKIRTVIKRESAHHVRIPPKVKLLRSNPHRLTAIRFRDADPVDAPDDEYIINTQVRRLEPAPLAPWDDGEPISSYAETRLLLARHFALKRARERRGQTD
jgi:hypothetical protein